MEKETSTTDNTSDIRDMLTDCDQMKSTSGNKQSDSADIVNNQSKDDVASISSHNISLNITRTIIASCEEEEHDSDLGSMSNDSLASNNDMAEDDDNFCDEESVDLCDDDDEGCNNGGGIVKEDDDRKMPAEQEDENANAKESNSEAKAQTSSGTEGGSSTNADELPTEKNPNDDSERAVENCRAMLNSIDEILKGNSLFCSNDRRTELSTEIAQSLGQTAPNTIIAVLGNTGVGKVCGRR